MQNVSKVAHSLTKYVNLVIVTFLTISLNMSPYVKPNIKEYPPGEPIWYDLIANTTRKVFQKKDNSVKGKQESTV